jgi:hypothetical protein
MSSKLEKTKESIKKSLDEIGWKSYLTPIDTPFQIALVMRGLGDHGRHAHPQYDNTMLRLLNLWKKVSQNA